MPEGENNRRGRCGGLGVTTRMVNRGKQQARAKKRAPELSTGQVLSTAPARADKHLEATQGTVRSGPVGRKYYLLFEQCKTAVNFWSTGNGPWQGAPVEQRQFVERVLPLSILGVALVSVPLMIWSPSGLPRLDQLRQEKTQSALASSRLSAEIRQLREEVERVKTDPSHVERAARDELGLVRRTEIVFQFAK